MKLREESWSLIADGVEHNDLAKQGEGQLKVEAAFEVLRNWGQKNGSVSQLAPVIPTDFGSELAVYLAAEQRVLDQVNSLPQPNEPTEASQLALANQIEGAVPDLRMARLRLLRKIPGASRANPALIELVSGYSLANQQRFELQIIALRKHDAQSTEEFQQKTLEYEELGEKLSQALAGSAITEPPPKTQPPAQ